MTSATEISSGYESIAVLEVWQTGLACDAQGHTLYVAAALDNAIYAASDATEVGQNGGTWYRIYSDNLYLHGAPALTLAPSGNLICSSNHVINVVAGQPSELVELTRGGKFVGEYSVDPNLGGSFGLAFGVVNGHATFAAVDDSTSQRKVWTSN